MLSAKMAAILSQPQCVNSLTPGDVMYNGLWWVQLYSFKGIFTVNAQDINPKNDIDNYTFKIAATSPKSNE